MKKLAFYLPLGIAVALAAVLGISWINRRSRAATTVNQSSGADYMIGTGSDVSRRFRDFDYNMMLNTHTNGGEAEITLLQYMLNAYYGGTTSVNITGKFDEPTKAAVLAITGKTTTTIYEFEYYYLSPQRGPDVADALVNNLTGNV